MEENEQPQASTPNAADVPARRRLLGMAAGAAFVVGSFAAGAVALTGSDAPSDQSGATDARSTSLPGAPEAPRPAPAEARLQPDPGAAAPIAPAVHSAPAGAGDTSSTRLDPPRQAAPPAARPAPPPARPAPPPAPAPQQPAPQQAGPLQQTLSPVTDTAGGLVGTVGSTVGGLVPALSMIDGPLGGLLGG